MSGTKNIKVLHLRSSNFYGGPERQIHFHARLAGKESVDVAVSSFSENNSKPDFLKTIEADGTEIKLFEVANAYDQNAVNIIKDYLESEKIDILCTHEYRSHYYGFNACKQIKTKWVAFSRGMTAENLKVKLFTYMERYFIKKANAIVAVSKSQKEKLVNQSVNPQIITTVHNAIDLSFVNSILEKSLKRKFSFPEDSFVIVSGGRFSKEKGQMYLVQAAELALEANRSLRFVLYGEGPDWEAVKSYINKKKLSEYIICPGFESELLAYLKSADLLVNPSLSEGLPNIVLEALASKVPVIVTNVGGHPEIVTDDFNGFLVEPKYISQMSERILEIADNKEKQDFFKIEGEKVLLDKFSFEAQNRKLINLYKSMVTI